MLGVVTEERIRVRYGETDQMGHAYYGNYLLWFEQARGAWCRDRGFTYKSLEEMGYYLPVAEAHVRYKGRVLYDDLILVNISLGEVRRSMMRFDYQIVNAETGAVTTEGYTRHMLVHKDGGTVSVPESVMVLLTRDPKDFERLT